MWSLLFLPKPCACVCMRASERVCVRVVPVFLEVFLSGWNSSNSHASLELRFKDYWVQVKGCRNEPSWHWATGETTSRSLPCLNECDMCVCVRVCFWGFFVFFGFFFFHVRFYWTTGINYTPSAWSQKPWKESRRYSNLYLQVLKQHTITLLFHFPFIWLSGEVQPWGTHCSPRGARRDDLVYSFIIQSNYASVTFLWLLWAFYTELQRVFVDVVETVVLSNVKRTPDVPIQLNLLSEEIARCGGHLFTFWTFCAKWWPQ